MYEKFGLFIGGELPLIGAREPSWMKPSAIVVNAARGGIVDEAALSKVLLSPRLSGAGLDVFDIEPPPADSPLLLCERTVSSPHSAGLTEEAAARMLVAAVTNIMDFFSGTLDPALVVNPMQLERCAALATSTNEGTTVSHDCQSRLNGSKKPGESKFFIDVHGAPNASALINTSRSDYPATVNQIGDMA